jgi:hypothetical protein
MSQNGSRTLWLFLSLLAAAAASLYMARILGPWEHFMDSRNNALTSTLGDLYPRWVGTRALLRNGKNPYGPDVSHEIQVAYYGHPITQSYDQPKIKIVDEQRFAYPVYVVFLLAPTARLTFATVQAWTPILLIALTGAGIVLWLKVLQWRPAMITAMAIIVFFVASPQVVQGLQLRQLGLLVGFLLALAAWCVVRNHLATAGAALALATIKPQMVVLPLAWFLIWSLGDLSKRWRLPAGFAGALAALIVAGEWILPGWLKDFLLGLIAYRKYVSSTPLLQLALGKWPGVVAGVLVAVSLLAWAWMNRKQTHDPAQFAVVLSAFLIGATVALPLTPPFNQVLLILPALMVIHDWAALPRVARLAFILIMGWPWITEIVLLLHVPQLNSPSRLPLLPLSLVLLVPFLIPFLLVMRRAPAAAT